MTLDAFLEQLVRHHAIADRAVVLAMTEGASGGRRAQVLRNGLAVVIAKELDRLVPLEADELERLARELLASGELP